MRRLEPPSDPCQHWFTQPGSGFCSWCGKCLIGSAAWAHIFAEDLSAGVNHYSGVLKRDQHRR